MFICKSGVQIERRYQGHSIGPEVHVGFKFQALNPTQPEQA